MVETLKSEIKKVLYYAYKNDLSFPRSCGLVSVLMSYLIAQKKDFVDKYEINCVRGCFNNVDSEDIWCEDYPLDITRYNYDKYDCNCHNCGYCDAMISHSWIELKNKNTSQITILDFTSIQFDSFIEDFEEDFHTIDFTEDSLFDYIEKKCLFVITEDMFLFKYYIPLSKSENALNYVEQTKECYMENKTNQIIEFLEYF